MTGKAFGMAVDLHRQGKLAEARRCYRDILAVDPSHREALSGLGQLEAHAGEHGVAAELFRARLSQVPTCSRTWTRLGDALMASGDADAAARAYQSAAGVFASGEPSAGGMAE
jgi:cytochrome c-type biogenesis protein CcmH/NrfG